MPSLWYCLSFMFIFWRVCFFMVSNNCPMFCSYIFLKIYHWALLSDKVPLLCLLSSILCFFFSHDWFSHWRSPLRFPFGLLSFSFHHFSLAFLQQPYLLLKSIFMSWNHFLILSISVFVLLGIFLSSFSSYLNILINYFKIFIWKF